MLAVVPEPQCTRIFFCTLLLLLLLLGLEKAPRLRRWASRFEPVTLEKYPSKLSKLNFWPFCFGNTNLRGPLFSTLKLNLFGKIPFALCRN